MGAWTVNSDGTVITVDADPSGPVVLGLAGEVGDLSHGRVGVTASLTVEQADMLWTILGTAIGIARAAKS